MRLTICTNAVRRYIQDMRISNYGVMFKIINKHGTTYCAADDIMQHIVFDDIANHLSVEVLRHGSAVSRCAIGIQDDKKIVEFLIARLIDEAQREN